MELHLRLVILCSFLVLSASLGAGKKKRKLEIIVEVRRRSPGRPLVRDSVLVTGIVTCRRSQRTA